MKTGEKVAVGAAVVLVAVGVAVGALAPTVLREVRRVSAPIGRMQRSQKAVEELSARKRWSAPPTDALTNEQLDRFFAVRRRIDALRRQSSPQLEALSHRNRNPQGLEGLKQMPGVLEGVSGIVTAEMDAYVAAGMSPEEYRWIERLVYQRWRSPLRRARTYPLAVRDAAAELAAAAGREPDPRVGRRLRELAEELRQRAPGSPEGFDSQIHLLLLARLDDIERYSMDDLPPFPGVR